MLGFYLASILTTFTIKTVVETMMMRKLEKEGIKGKQEERAAFKLVKTDCVALIPILNLVFALTLIFQFERIYKKTRDVILNQ